MERLLSDAASGQMGRVLEARFGRDGARDAMARRGGGAVFEAYFGATPGAVDGAFQEFCRGVVRTGARESIVGGMAPIGQ